LVGAGRSRVQAAVATGRVPDCGCHLRRANPPLKLPARNATGQPTSLPLERGTHLDESVGDPPYRTVMPNWRASTVGRYHTRCPAGACLNEATPGTSKIENELFTQLNFVLGQGEQGYAVQGIHQLKSDMAFKLDFEHVLVVEYDGAYWHQGREKYDLQKAEHITGPWPGGYHHVIRVREDPLRPLRRADVWIPRGTDPHTCARLVLQHAAHAFFGYYGAQHIRSRIEHFLIGTATPLQRRQVPCPDCWHLTRALRRAGRSFVLPSEHADLTLSLRRRR
jgi:hypothetical protein